MPRRSAARERWAVKRSQATRRLCDHAVTPPTLAQRSQGGDLVSTHAEARHAFDGCSFPFSPRLARGRWRARGWRDLVDRLLGIGHRVLGIQQWRRGNGHDHDVRLERRMPRVHDERQLHRRRGLRAVPGRHLLRSRVSERRRVRIGDDVHVGDHVRRRSSQCVRPEQQRVRDSSAYKQRPPPGAGGMRRGTRDDMRLARRPHGDRELFVLHDIDLHEDVPAERVLRRLVVRHLHEQVPGAADKLQYHPQRLRREQRRRRRYYGPDFG